MAVSGLIGWIRNITGCKTQIPVASALDSRTVSESTVANEFYDPAILERVLSVNKGFWNGYLILFDIKDSTARKREHPDRWYAQTEAFYRGFRNLARQLEELATRPDFHGLEDSDKRVVVKFSGDSGFAFLPLSYATSKAAAMAPPQELSQEIIRLAVAFQQATHSQPALGDLRLKAVVTYLTDLRPVRFDEEALSKRRAETSPSIGVAAANRDVLGRGLDFSFRLEQFAGAGYVVINTMLARSLTRTPVDDKPMPAAGAPYPVVEIEGMAHHMVECNKCVKGWDNPEGERFYLLVTEGVDEAMLENPSPRSGTVQAEIFRFHVSTAKRDEGQSAVPEPRYDELNDKEG